MRLYGSDLHITIIDKGFTLPEVSRLSGVSLPTLYRVLSHGNSSFSTLYKICKAIGEDMQTFTINEELDGMKGSEQI